MTPDAYIVRKKYYTDKNGDLWSCNKAIKKLFDIGINREVFYILSYYGDDKTNDEFYGELHLKRREWTFMKNEYMIDKNLHMVVENNKKIFQEIDEYFYWNPDKILILDCK